MRRIPMDRPDRQALSALRQLRHPRSPERWQPRCRIGFVSLVFSCFPPHHSFDDANSGVSRDDSRQLQAGLGEQRTILLLASLLTSVIIIMRSIHFAKLGSFPAGTTIST